MRFTATLFIMLIFTGALGQTSETILIYGKLENGQYYGALLSSTAVIRTYPIPSNRCGCLSPNGLLGAFILDRDNPDYLSFMYRPTQQIFANILWDEQWHACTQFWPNNNTVRISAAGSNETAVMLNIENYIVQEASIVFPPMPTLPELPFAYGTVMQYIIPSNNRIKVFHESCPDEPVIPLTEEICAGPVFNVIYDTVLQRNVGIITDSVPKLLSGSMLGGPMIYSIGYHAWSPDDRYLWYSTRNNMAFDDFRVYDTVLEW